MNQNTYYTLLDTLYYNTLLSSQVFKIDSKDNLQIVELSPLKNRNETIPLDLIDSEPKVSNKFDNQLVAFSLISALAACGFLFSAIYTSQLWAIPFSILFLLTSLTTAYASYRKKTTTYSYQFMDTNTRLFSLHESFSANKQVEMFVHALNERINKAHNEQDDLSVESDLQHSEDDGSISDEAKQSQFTKHLDFLYNHGVVNDALYKRIDRKINEKVFGFKIEETETNVINFPVKAL